MLRPRKPTAEAIDRERHLLEELFAPIMTDLRTVVSPSSGLRFEVQKGRWFWVFGDDSGSLCAVGTVDREVGTRNALGWMGWVGDALLELTPGRPPCPADPTHALKLFVGDSELIWMCTEHRIQGPVGRGLQDLRRYPPLDQR